MHPIPHSTTSLSEAAESLLGRLADEYLSACARGEEPNVEELAAAHPELADLIRRLFPAMLFLKSAGQTPLTAPGLTFDGTLGEFELLREIGRGGMGVVYEARQRSLGRRVALKVLPLAGILDDRHLKRFQNEAHAAAVLQHPHIVPVYGVGCDRGVHYYAMQLIDGLSLAEILRRSDHRSADRVQPGVVEAESSTAPFARISTHDSRSAGHRCRSIAQLVAQVAEALHHAHQEGIIHRDIKPSNLMLDQQGKIWVTDFGLARVQVDGDLTKTGDVVGTLRYMSPEQLLDHRIVDQRTDVYSLGLTLYELITGIPAFPRGEREQLVRRILNEPPPPPRKIDPNIPADLETIVLKATAKDAAERYASARDFAEDLRRFVEKRPILARRATPVERLAQWCRRNPLVAGLSAVLVCLLATLAVGGPLVAIRQMHLTREAVAAKETAEVAEQKSRTQLYVSDMALAYEAWEQSNLKSIKALLNRHLPQAGQSDVRGFEWYLLNGLYERCQTNVVARHEQDLYYITVSPDGRFLASLGKGRVKIWNARSMQCVRELGDDISAVTFLPDRPMLAIGDHGGNVKICEIDSGPFLETFPGHTKNVIGVVFTPDGRYFASGSDDASVRVWDREQRTVLAQFSGEVHNAHALGLSPRGDLLAVGNQYARTIDVRAFPSGERLAELKLPQGSVHAVAFSPDGTILAGGGFQGPICLWDVSSNSEVAQLASIRSIAAGFHFSPNGRILAVANEDATVRLWEVATGKSIETLRGHKQSVQAVDYLPDGKTLISASDDYTIRRWDVSQYDRTTATDNDAGDSSRVQTATVAFSHDGQRLYVGATSPQSAEHSARRGALLRHDLVSGQVQTVFPERDLKVTSIAEFRNGECLALGSVRWEASDRFGEINLCCPLTGRQLTQIEKRLCNARTALVAVSPDGRFLATATGRPAVTLWALNDSGNAAAIRQIPFRHAESLAFSPDSHTLAVGGGDWSSGQVRLCSVQGKGDIDLGGHSILVNGIAFSPDGQTLASCGHEGFVKLWDVASGSLRFELQDHVVSVFCVAISADGKTVASGDGDGTIRFWQLVSGSPVGYLHCPARVWSLQFSPDGRSLAAGLLDGTVRLLNLRGEDELLRIP